MCTHAYVEYQCSRRWHVSFFDSSRCTLIIVAVNYNKNIILYFDVFWCCVTAHQAFMSKHWLYVPVMMLLFSWLLGKSTQHVIFGGSTKHWSGNGFLYSFRASVANTSISHNMVELYITVRTTHLVPRYNVYIGYVSCTASGGYVCKLRWVGTERVRFRASSRTDNQ